MLSKCANPACTKQFMHLHEGQVFRLTPTPEVEAAIPGFAPSLYERFWLCDQCCRRMTLVWGGTEAKLVPISDEGAPEILWFGGAQRVATRKTPHGFVRSEMKRLCSSAETQRNEVVTAETHQRAA